MTKTKPTKTGHTPRPDNCECDNTHEQNNTCCQPCWNAGFRSVASAPDMAKELAQLRADKVELLEMATLVDRWAKGEVEQWGDLIIKARNLIAKHTQPSKPVTRTEDRD